VFVFVVVLVRALWVVFAGANGKFSGGADIGSLQSVKKGELSKHEKNFLKCFHVYECSLET
jgi:enoyl-CoA hydratase/carnithine racemase